MRGGINYTGVLSWWDICIFHVTEINLLNVLKLKCVCQEQGLSKSKRYTQTKFCPLDVYDYRFHMHARIPFRQLSLNVSNVVHQNEIHLIINSATDNTANASTLRIKGHAIRSLCVWHNPVYEYETSCSIAIQLCPKHHWVGGRATKGFGQDRIRTLVSMATDIPIGL